MKRLLLILPLLFVFSCKNGIKNDTTTDNINYQLSGFSLEETQKTIQDYKRELINLLAIQFFNVSIYSIFKALIIS